MDVVENLKVSDVYEARPVFDKCPFCQLLVIYKSHKENCQERIKTIQSGGKDDFTPTNAWEIEQKQHKTDSIGAIQLVWPNDFYKLVKNWISVKGLKNWSYHLTRHLLYHHLGKIQRVK